jgi:uncharacterized NAD-dependent epimerase/dehydratase family protein
VTHPDGTALPVLKKPYLLFVGDVDDLLTAKTACGLRDWIPEDIAGQWRLTPDSVDLGLKDLDPAAAYAAGARSIVIGVAPVGGQLPAHWAAALTQAASAGLDIVSGLHSRIADIPQVAEAARAAGTAIYDVRKGPAKLPVGTGLKRPGKRLLTVGTDCAIGKKYTALAIARELQARRIAADFRATGQTGMMIAGGGIAIDSVVADFIAGAAELLSPAAAPDHWDIIEGQGSLFHPGYAGVALGLLHGSQPDWLVLCHDPLRPSIDGFSDFPLPDLATAIRRNVEAASLTNPACRCAGIALNTSKLAEPEARGVLAKASAETGLPAADPLRWGVAAIVDGLL